MDNFYLICFFLFLFSLTKFEVLNSISEVSLTIKGKGYQYILSNQKSYETTEFTELPEEVIINDIVQNETNTKQYYLTEEINYIKMRWINSQVTSCDGMFNKMKNITSVDFSKFDTSNVIKASYMFAECNSLVYINLKGFNTSRITSMKKMFYYCQSLEFLDLSDFDTSSVNNMYLMFQNCYSLKFVDLSSFDTSLVTDMNYMFQSCHSLKSLNLSNFYTPSLEVISNMFYGCYSLEYLNIEHITTSKVESLASVFYNCYSLKTLDLSNFDTSLVTSLNNMVNNCTSLLYLDLQSFNTNKVTDVTLAFAYCTSLIYLNIINFNLKSVTLFDNFITYTYEYLIYCVNGENLSDDIKAQLNSNTNMRNECDNSCFNANNKLIPSKKKCIESCKKDETYLYEFNNICYEQCPNYTSENTKNDFICKEDLFCGDYFYFYEQEKCLNYIPKGYYLNNSYLNILYKCQNKCSECNLESTNNNLCISCNIDNEFYPKEFDNSNIDSFVNCYNEEPNGYYLDSNENIFKAKTNNIEERSILEESSILEERSILEESTEKIKEKENQKENENTDGKEKEIVKSSEIKIEEKQEKESEKTYIQIKEKEEISSIFYTSEILEENTITNKLEYNNNTINETNKIELEEEKNLCNLKSIIENKCIFNSSETKLSSNEEMLEELLDGLLNDIINDIKETNVSYTIKTDKDKIQISFLNKQNKTKNEIYINFKDLKEKLIQDNNIPINEDLILLKIEHYIEQFNIPLIEYLLFSSDGKKQINLDSYKNYQIQIEIPVAINEKEEYRHNPQSTYYNDICDKYETDLDITLYDRKEEYNKNNMSLCEANCTYLGYDYYDKEVKCECPIKTTGNFFLDNNIDTSKLLNKFINVKSILNFDVLKCTNQLFSKEGLISNIGSYTSLVVILLSIIESIIFCLSGFNILYSQMKTLTQIKNSKSKTVKKNIKRKNFPPKKIKNKKSKNKNKSKSKERMMNFPSNKALNLNQDIKELNSHPIMTNEFKNEEFKRKKGKLNKMYKTNIIYEYNDYEINSLPYKEALEIDKRTCTEYYLSLIRIKQLIIFTFYTKTDYNSRIIKINLFFFFLILYFAVNAIFFNDSTMHQIFEDKGKFNFIYHIPQMLYSTAISAVIKMIIEKLSLTEKSLLEIKQEKDHDKAVQRMNKTLRIIKIKFSIYFILNFLFLFCFWFYLSSFCAVYKNTQLHLFKDSIISFCGSLIYPFAINILPAILRYNAINCKKKDRECLYQLSKIFQII